MTIKKFLHSCLLIEEGGKKLLIDPGEFSFVEGKLKPEDLAPADFILITHEHSDHFFPEAIQKISKTGKPEIITHERIAELLKEKGIEARIIKSNEELKIGAFTIKAFAAPHGELIVPTPENFGYIINGKFLHPGDSLEFPNAPIDTVALPITAPWLTLKAAYEAALRLKPKTVIPIHDAFVKDFMLSRIYAMLERKLTENKITWKPLNPDEGFSVS